MVVECPVTSPKGGSRKLSLGNYSWLLSPKVMAEGLPSADPNQAMMVVQITNI